MSAVPAKTLDRPARRPAATLKPIPAGDGVVICTIARPVGGTGVQTHTRMLRSAIEQAGIRCDVIDPFGGSPKWLPIFAVRKAIAPFNGSLSTQWYRHWHAAALREQLIHRLKAGRPRVLIAQCPVAAQAAIDAVAALRMAIPISLVVHFNHSEATEYRELGQLANRRAFEAMLNFEARVLREVDQVIYVSEWARRVVETERGIKPRAAAVIWNGIAELPSSPSLTRQSIGLSPDDKILLNVGTLEPRKNQIGLLDVFANVAGREPKARLLLVGDGPQRRQIEKKIASLRLTDRVRLLGRRGDVPALLALADLYVHFALVENCPVVLLEAARAGIASVAAAGGGVGEILAALEQPRTLPNDASSAAGRIVKLLGDEGRRAQLAAAARRNFQRTFTATAMAEAFLATLGVGRPR
jgi:glycosyltransferase involved in cell wall biosynthesis